MRPGHEEGANRVRPRLIRSRSSLACRACRAASASRRPAKAAAVEHGAAGSAEVGDGELLQAGGCAGRRCWRGDWHGATRPRPQERMPAQAHDTAGCIGKDRHVGLLLDGRCGACGGCVGGGLGRRRGWLGIQRRPLPHPRHVSAWSVIPSPSNASLKPALTPSRISSLSFHSGIWGSDMGAPPGPPGRLQVCQRQRGSVRPVLDASRRARHPGGGRDEIRTCSRRWWPGRGTRCEAARQTRCAWPGSVPRTPVEEFMTRC